MDRLIQQTVILGGGFTGLYAALKLRRNHHPHSVILVDREARFRFRPLLYDYFSEQMDQQQVMPRFEELLGSSGVRFVQDTVAAIDLSDRQVRLHSGRVCPYSHLVIALGSVTGYFGVEGASEYAIAFRDSDDAIALDRKIRTCLDQARQSANPDRRRLLLTFVIIGGGPTGVELAATLADLVPNWFEELGGDPQEVRIVLLSRGAQILKGDINDPLRETAEQQLQRRAVEVITEAAATAVRPKAVDYQQAGQTATIPAATAVWTAGTAAHPLVKDLPIAEQHRDRKGRLIVTPTMQLPEFPEVFAGGDCATVEGESLPPTAQVAHQQGLAIAQNLQALVEGRQLQPADAAIRGTLMKLGLEAAAANIDDRVEVDGEIAHLIRQATYLSRLPSPIHNLQAEMKWFNDAVVDRYLEPQDPGKVVQWVAGAIVAAAVARKVVHALGSDEKSV
ncbi:NAD(P)/FAD-dependent oxidoreductase [Romeria aff. gracilis LEGE 07310]|uniref:NAD(P)/FAD-dependent oxidoreductase n=1 Tax=Vasconcelosia minhoensis LEGE 07310 TaxID=915328 RepID=A0A8J7A700_9CYAN|nr:NAD(P)/FAD-dependent oxidoreductase [Romeria gracilis]MBE9078002.1 NAD(P)/FAD-dependent oxidoreductase [Romeria aff. gracilis LEGE 07310]